MTSRVEKSPQGTGILAGIVGRGKLVKGMYTYHAKPKRRGDIKDAFNGQHGRQAIFCSITGAIEFDRILETGTYLGLTTEYMHKTSGLDVLTAEWNPKFYGFSRERFKKMEGVSIRNSDSRAFLRSALAGLGSVRKPLFFYLDAHWYADLPLLDEVKIVFEMHPKSVILVDDFRVPEDTGYGYDDYGHGNTLHMAYFEPVSNLRMKAFFPTLPSEDETGAKRGCVVLANDPEIVETLRSLDVLREGSEAGTAVPAH